MNQLRTENLVKTFPLNKKMKEAKHTDLDYIKAVDHLSLTLYPGEIYGLLGPNGAGKTTALRIIASLMEAQEGSIYYQDKNIKDDIDDYRRHIGFLTSELKLDDFFTPSYTFTYMARLYGMEENAIEERKKLLFERFGISSFQNTKISNLSTGMKQKASLAIALAHDPSIIIFDEPTNGLDLVASRDVENFLLDQKKEGKILLVSTHIFSLVEKLCDKVGILLDGQLKLEGDLKELTKEASLETRFFDLYEKEAHHE